MPTSAGIPLQGPPQVYRGGLQNQFDWLSINQQELAGAQQSALMRGQPMALAWWQTRSMPGPPAPMMQPTPIAVSDQGPSARLRLSAPASAATVCNGFFASIPLTVIPSHSACCRPIVLSVH